MELYFCKIKGGNIGDDINAWLWKDLLPELFGENSVEGTFVGIGTVLKKKIYNYPKSLGELSNIHIVGTGAGYGEPPEFEGRSDVHIHGLRGPLTAAAIGVGEELVLTDGAIALALHEKVCTWMEEEKARKKENEATAESASHQKVIGFMPHHVSADYGQWEKVCKKAGLVFLDPRADAEKTMRQMMRCDLILTEAMHGAIIADTLRVPWVALSSSVDISAFKWTDWCLGMGLKFEPVWIEKSSFFEKMRDVYVSYMDGDSFLFSKQAKAGEKVEMPANAEEILLKDYNDRVAKGQRVKVTFCQRIKKYLAYRLMKVQGNCLLNLLLKPYQSYKLCVAARCLKKVSEQASGTLSSDQVFAEKLQRMKMLLEELRALK